MSMLEISRFMRCQRTTDGIQPQRRRSPGREVLEWLGKCIQYRWRTRNGISLRILLAKVRGHVSYKTLMTYGVYEYESCWAPCIARGFLRGNIKWKVTSGEAELSASPRQFPSLFTAILLFSHHSQPGVLWKKFRSDIIEDFLRNHAIYEDAAL